MPELYGLSDAHLDDSVRHCLDLALVESPTRLNGFLLNTGVDERLTGRTQGMLTCPEVAAPLAAFQHLRRQGWIKDDETVLLFSTGNGLKYAHLWNL